MEIYIDINKKALVKSVTDSTSAKVPTFVKGDKYPMLVHLVKDGEEKFLDLENETLKMSISTLQNGILSYIFEYTLSEDNVATFELPLNTTNIADALDGINALSVKLEFQYSNTNGEIRTILQVPSTLQNESIDEDTPLELQPTFQSYVTKAETAAATAEEQAELSKEYADKAKGYADSITGGVNLDQIQADLSQTDDEAVDFVKGKEEFLQNYLTLTKAAELLEDVTADFVVKEEDKGLSTNDYTDTEKTKLANIETGAQVNKVISVNAKTGAVTLSASDFGLGNVDNTSDADKPISTATQAALNALNSNIEALAPTSVTDTASTDISVAIAGNTVYTYGELDELEFSTVASSLYASFVYFTSGSTATTLTYPSNIKTIGEIAIEANTSYVIGIFNNTITLETLS